MIDVISLNIFVFLMAGTLNDGGLKIASPGVIGQNDLLIVGPGVLGRTVAEKWHKDSPVVPVGRSPRTDVLLKAEKEALDIGG
ncbi:hypothetical protein GW17_00008697 [Ensete ventricosum]|nr:hypothetical protein GW17_00008697 [Ensete ventricosum]RZR92679.1 hypothetical protein BHM03_00021022 [Ensete ventricosum]